MTIEVKSRAIHCPGCNIEIGTMTPGADEPFLPNEKMGAVLPKPMCVACTKKFNRGEEIAPKPPKPLIVEAKLPDPAKRKDGTVDRRSKAATKAPRGGLVEAGCHFLAGTETGTAAQIRAAILADFPAATCGSITNAMKRAIRDGKARIVSEGPLTYAINEGAA